MYYWSWLWFEDQSFLLLIWFATCLTATPPAAIAIDPATPIPGTTVVTTPWAMSTTPLRTFPLAIYLTPRTTPNTNPTNGRPLAIFLPKASAPSSTTSLATYFPIAPTADIFIYPQI